MIPAGGELLNVDVDCLLSATGGGGRSGGSTTLGTHSLALSGTRGSSTLEPTRTMVGRTKMCGTDQNSRSTQSGVGGYTTKRHFRRPLTYAATAC